MRRKLGGREHVHGAAPRATRDVAACIRDAKAAPSSRLLVHGIVRNVQNSKLAWWVAVHFGRVAAPCDNVGAMDPAPSWSLNANVIEAVIRVARLIKLI